MLEPRQWTCVEVSCDPAASENLAVFVAEAFGVGIELADGGLRFYLDEKWPAAVWEPVLRRVLESAPEVDSGLASPAWSSHMVADEDWAAGWKKHFKPLRVGSRFVICPTWETFDAGPRDRVLLIDPGMAFGTGHHETTRLCLEWLEQFADAGGTPESKTVLDVGTGSGILAAAAALLGFAGVVALDNDPEAVEVAGETIRNNGIARKVRLICGTTAEIGETFDVVIANIQSQPLIRMADQLIRCAKIHGRLALSGILREQLDEVKRAYVERGMRLAGTRLDGEWGLLIFEK